MLIRKTSPINFQVQTINRFFVYMKYYFSVLILLVAFANLSAQELFQRVYGGDGYDAGAEVIELSDGNFLIAGSSGSYEAGMSSQIMLLKANVTGHKQWTETYGGPFADRAESMVEDVDGNFLIAGYTETTESSYQGYALKVDGNGDTIWTRKYGGDAWDFFYQAVALNDGGFALFGQTYSYGAGEGDYYLVRIDAAGDTIWTRTYGGELDEEGKSISLADDGGFFLGGNTKSFGGGSSNMLVVRTDALGDTLWTDVHGGIEDDFCNAIAATADGGYVIGGGTYNQTPGKSDVWIQKEGGTQQWVATETHAGNSEVTDLIVEPGTQNVTMAGYAAPGDFGGVDGRIVRYGADGVWNGVAKSHGSENIDKSFDIKLTADNGYVLVGTTDGFLGRFDDVWLVKTNSLGLTVGPQLGVDEINLGGQSFAVRFAPNPVADNSIFVIDGFEEIRNRLSGNMSITIFDALGRQLVSEKINGGVSPIDLSHLAIGVHFYQLKADDRLLATGKLIKTN